MRGLSTTTLLLAAVLEGTSFASDGTEMTLFSAPADIEPARDAGILFLSVPVSTTDHIQETIAFEIHIGENDEFSLYYYDEAYVEDLESIVKEFRNELDARNDRRVYTPSLEQNPDDISNCNGSPGCIMKSAFRKSIKFITSLGSGTADGDGFSDRPRKPPGKGHWHWPKLPFPHHGNHTHHGHGNHTHGNHTFPHFPHHGNHTHGNHTHGNHTHPPHHPPFRLPPHFCRPPHRKPRHKKPHHPPPHDDKPPIVSWGPEPPYITAEGDVVYVSPAPIHPIHRPLVQITITPAKLIISALLGMIILRIFHRIRTAARRRYMSHRKTRFRNFVSKLGLFSRRREQIHEPLLDFYHEHGDDKVVEPLVYYSDYCDEQVMEKEKEGYLDCDELDEKQGGENQYDYCDEKRGEENISSVSDELVSFRSAADLVCDMVIAAEEGRAVRGVPGEVGPGGTWKEGN